MKDYSREFDNTVYELVALIQDTEYEEECRNLIEVTTNCFAESFTMRHYLLNYKPKSNEVEEIKDRINTLEETLEGLTDYLEVRRRELEIKLSK